MKLINIIRLLIFVAVIIIASYTLAPKDKPNSELENMEAKITIRKDCEIRIAAKKPQVVLLGNSMLGRGVDEMGFEILTGKKTLKFWTGGGASAWWYLTMKNVICQAKPETVILFFRDQYLTEPTFRVNGKSKPHMDDMCDEKEPVLERIAYTEKMNPASYFLHQYLPLYAKRDRAHNKIQALIRNSSTGLLLNMPRGAAKKAVARVFDNKNMNQELLTIRQLNAEKAEGIDAFNFKKRLGHSFLPHIIEIAKKHDINLVFVRVKKRRDLEPDKEPEELKVYIRELTAYLKDQNCVFQDYTYDPKLKLEHYADGDHLNPEKGVRLFTEILSRQIVPILTAKEKTDPSG